MVRVGGWVETTGVNFNSSMISLHSKHSHGTSEKYSTFKDRIYVEELR